MYFQKIHHPYNFAFAEAVTSGARGSLRFEINGKKLRGRITDHGDNVFHLEVKHGRWGKNPSLTRMHPPNGAPSTAALTLDQDGALALTATDGGTLLGGIAAGGIGVSGQAWMVQFQPDTHYQFYGMGEKTNGFEKSGARTKFWNTDVFADFPYAEIARGNTDPMYVSIPYMIVKRANTYVGILLDNPYACFMSANGQIGRIANQQDVASHTSFFLGADNGAPSVWVIVGPTLAELTRKYQRLVGTTPLPPLWALGHQQCRWGYRSMKDLRELERAFRRYDIPNDGLWLDIDYMTDFKVFTWNSAHFKDVKKEVAALRKHGHRVVPILDPGVKNEKGYAVRDSGLKANAFCKTGEGRPFLGFVWPGDTLFPDFSRADARAWWAEHVRRFAALGIEGAWLDMNDPSVGRIELDNMRFEDGKAEHAAYHNQYGLGMAMATRDGFLAAHPDKRTFLISRSGFTGSQNHSAIWTGDNISNDVYMKGAIPCSLNLALSGVPFNGPDVPGFGGDADDSLALRWYKAGFLFPFLRNHSATGTARQEPWAFNATTRNIIKHYIQLRYKLLPYLYNLFIDQEAHGDAIMRPLFYEFEDTPELPLSEVDDAYLLGPALLHAPIFDPQSETREVPLPTGWWFDAINGGWKRGGRKARAKAAAKETPLYVRSGQLIPMLAGLPTDNKNDLSEIELHCFLRPGETATYRYRCDDGESFGYQRGERTEIEVTVTATRKALRLGVRAGATGWKPVTLRVVTYGEQQALSVNGIDADILALPLKPHHWRFTGRTLRCRQSEPIRIS